MTTARCVLAPVLALSTPGSLVMIPRGATVIVNGAPAPSGFIEVLWESMTVRVLMYDLDARTTIATLKDYTD